MSSLRLLAAVALAAAAGLLAGCGSSGSVPLVRLASNQDAYIGKEVTTSGRVEEQTNPGGSHYYVLTDRAQNLVALVPARCARPYAGRDVSITGRFTVEAQVGRVIRVASIALAR